MPNNPNDISAVTYDIVSLPLKPTELTQAEIVLIQGLLPTRGKVLDVGGGTGRHAVPLSELGHDVSVIDSAELMLAQLEAKTDKVTVIQSDALTYTSVQNSFDLIILMWNAFNEIALTVNQADSLLQNLAFALKPKGKILINIDNPDNFDPETLQFELTQKNDALEYRLDSHVVKFERGTNTTTSLEHVVVTGQDGSVVSETSTEIVQRWWKLNEIQAIASKLGFSLKLENIKFNAELYLVLEN